MRNRKMYELEKLEFLRNPSHESAQKLFKVLVENPCGIYASQELEEFYTTLAKKTNTVESTPAPVAETFLHVMTMCYKTGGHTRVVERWIESSPTEQKHRVLFTESFDTSQIPEKLSNESSNSGGPIISLEEETIELKANELRTIAQGYEYVVLHHHMHDPVPLMAFSMPELRAKVIVFNHAGHLPWLGASVADLVLCHEKQQQKITRHLRHCKNTKLLDLMLDRNFLSDKFHVSNIASGSCTLVSMATAYKYECMNEFDFVSDIEEVLDAHRDVKFIGIGMDAEEVSWARLMRRFGDRVCLKGVLSHDEVSKILRESDIYLDSFPQNSWTSVLDAITMAKLPVVVRRAPTGLMPFMEQYECVSNCSEDWLTRVGKLIESRDYRKRMANWLYGKAIDECSGEKFQRTMSNIYSNWGACNELKSDEYSEVEFKEYYDFWIEAGKTKLNYDLKEKIKALESDLARHVLMIHQKNLTIGSAVDWQSKPWYTRAFHKWRPESKA